MLRENFNEVHVKSIISGAVEGHLNRVEAKITSSAQSMVGTAIKASEEKINAGIVGRVKDCLGREVMKTRERENELEEQLTSDIDFKKQVNLLLASQLGEFKECLVKDIGKMTKEKIRDSKIERDMMKEMVNNTMDEVKEMMKGQKALDSEDLEVMRARVLDLEQRVHASGAQAYLEHVRHELHAGLFLAMAHPCRLRTTRASCRLPRCLL